MRSTFITHEVDPDTPVDYFPHFPAGPRSPVPGSAARHQRANAGKRGWVPFAPQDPKFIWRASVCGDGKHGPYEHMKGGVYYYDGAISATYRQGGHIDVEVGINAHHNGYIELHVCDVSKCPGGDISEECFRAGKCYKLQRAWVGECQKGDSKRCGPIDKRNPGRWYLPCYGYRDGSGTIVRYGRDGTMRFKLPDHLHCDRCVVHWFWTAANTCNPPGVRDYFTGPDRPRGWGNCRGQGGARGGFAANQRDCGPKYDKYAEEYMSCADVRVVPRNASTANAKPSVVPTPRPEKKAAELPKKKEKSAGTKPKGTYNARAAYRRGRKAVRDIVLVDRGVRVASLNVVNRVRVRAGSRFSIEALTEPHVAAVTFQVDGIVVGTDARRPFFIMGNRGNGVPSTWSPPTSRCFIIMVMARGDTVRVDVFTFKSDACG